MQCDKINNTLYNMLKDILKLQDGCQKFVLEVENGLFPLVTQTIIIGTDAEVLTQEQLLTEDDE